MLEPSEVDRALWILQDLCPGCGSDVHKANESHCRNLQCPEAHASLRRAIDRSPSLRDLELQEAGQGRNLYETLSIIWFDNNDH